MKVGLALIGLCAAVSVHAVEDGYIYNGSEWTVNDTKTLGSSVTLTPQPLICWESGDPTITSSKGLAYDFVTMRSVAEAAVSATWEHYSNILFRWQNSITSDCDITINMHADEPQAWGNTKPGLGKYAEFLDMNFEWMLPMVESSWVPASFQPYQGWNSPGVTNATRASLQWNYFKEIFIHEFGHILGISHEQNRLPPGSPGLDPQGANGNVEIGAYDIYSIMNYNWIHLMNQGKPVVKLSCGDVASARALYGTNPSLPNLTPNCTQSALNAATPSQLSAPNFPAFVNDANLNTFDGTTDNDVDPASIGSYSSTRYPNNGRQLNVQITINLASTSTPGYNITFALKDPNYPEISCATPMDLQWIRAGTNEQTSSNEFPFSQAKMQNRQGSYDCSEYSDCSTINFSDVHLSPCNVSQSVWIPAGKGTYDFNRKIFVFKDCHWVDENVVTYLGEKLTFGLVSNGTSKCIERNGSYSSFQFQVSGSNGQPGTDPISLPFSPDKVMSMYPLLPTTHFLQSQSFIHLNSGGTPKSFFIDKYEVTQADYYAVMGKLPFHFLSDVTRPAETVTWFDAVLYCNQRSLLEGLKPVYSYSAESDDVSGSCIGLTGLSMDFNANGYRLPTPQEWDDAFQAGTNTDYYWGSKGSAYTNSYGWYSSNSNANSHPVGLKSPNQWGLYDMFGNVSEWTGDPNFYNGMQCANGLSWNNQPEIAGGAGSAGSMPTNNSYACGSPSGKYSFIGFRVIRRFQDIGPARNLLLSN